MVDDAEQGILRNLRISTVRWIVDGLLWLLPIDQKQDLLEYREQMSDVDPLALDIEIEFLNAVLDAWKGRISLLQDIPQDFLAHIDPRYVGVVVYQKFGMRAVALLEEEFIEDAYRIALPSLRLGGFLMIFSYAVLAILDIWYLPETRLIAWAIRVVVCILLCGTTLISFYGQFFKQYNQWVTGLAVFIAGIGNVLIIALSHSTELGHSTYYAILHVLIMYINLLSGLRFFPALWVSLALVGCYEGTELWLNDAIISDRATRSAFISSSFFLVTDIILGCASSNMRERSDRISFMIRYAISHSFKDFLRYFEYEKPETLLYNLSKIRYAPAILKTFMVQVYGLQSDLILPVSQSIQTSERGLMPLVQPISAADSALDSASKNMFGDKPESSSCSFPQVNWTVHFTKLMSRRLHRLTPALFWKQFYTKNSEQLQSLEKAFERDSFYGAIASIRLLLIDGMLVYLAFAFDDYYCLPETQGISIPIRLVGFSVILLIMVLTFQEVLFQKVYKLVVSAGVAYAGLGITAMIAFSRPGEAGYFVYYAGLIQTMYPLFFLCRLPFSIAVSIGLVFIASYEFVALVFQELQTSSLGIEILVNNSIFLVSAFFIGAISCYAIDRDHWLEFLTLRSVAYKTSELLAYYESENPSPRQMLDLINSIRHSPQRLEKVLLNLESFRCRKV